LLFAVAFNPACHRDLTTKLHKKEGGNGARAIHHPFTDDTSKKREATAKARQTREATRYEPATKS